MACTAPATEVTYNLPSLRTGAERNELPARNCHNAFSGERAAYGFCPPLRALSLSSVGQSSGGLELPGSMIIKIQTRGDDARFASGLQRPARVFRPPRCVLVGGRTSSSRRHDGILHCPR